MINSVFRYGIIFIILILLQVLLLGNINFGGFINPYVYVMFIMLLPVEMPEWIILIISFFTGLVMDFFSGTTGMNTGATVAAGFVRPYILRIISPRDGYEPGASPSMLVYGFRWFLLYSLLVVSVHHFILFFLEVFRFTDFFRTLLRIILSTAFTVSFILLIEYYRRGTISRQK
ncbi:MAG TPA: rod shape-determining protein MreD [Bacteroidales bacterium]|nr:rod shape-determining protein MreD [Bacteroidales bacterium]